MMKSARDIQRPVVYDDVVQRLVGREVGEASVAALAGACIRSDATIGVAWPQADGGRLTLAEAARAVGDVGVLARMVEDHVCAESDGAGWGRGRVSVGAGWLVGSWSWSGEREVRCCGDEDEDRGDIGDHFVYSFFFLFFFLYFS